MALILPLGFQFAGVRCGLKNKRNDLGLIVSEHKAIAAGVFTTNQVRAACVDHSRSVISGGLLQALVVNSGNANCCTGPQGERDTLRMAELAASSLKLDPGLVAVGSTGVIGQPLDMTKVEKGILDASKKLGPDPVPFMNAILTTDLVEKWAAVGEGKIAVPGKVQTDLSAHVYGVAKGSGMIAPNMATMLSFIVSDYDVEGIDLDQVLRQATESSFNCMTVDGDTSTNDMLILMANGASRVKPDPAVFQYEVTQVCESLAKQVARDGEGATKLVEVQVTGTANPKQIARTIADSPLVKTAMFGCDPNWGRILMAAGRAGVPFSTADLHLTLHAGGESFVLFDHGQPADFDAKVVSTALKSDYVLIDLKIGEGEFARIYTCDFGYGYVRINAEYHT